MSKRSWAFIIGAAVVFAGSALYVAGLIYPFNTEGEGPFEENYPWGK